VFGTPHKPKPGPRVQLSSPLKRTAGHTSAENDIAALDILDGFGCAIIDFMAPWRSSDLSV
jgi:hypothetical protein